MNEKKVVVFIVEGPSDEAALGSVMKEFFFSDRVQFVVVHGDITLENYVSAGNILTKINSQIEAVKNKYRYRYNDFLKIIHIVDMDGVYIAEQGVKQTEVKEVQYYTDHVEASDAEAIIRRNREKAEILYKLRKTAKVHNIPYKIYYNSCNLEHVLYGELKPFTDEEKEKMSDDFAERFEGKVNEFIEFISNPEIAAPGTYQQTWDYIEKDKNSLNRRSNMQLIFDSEDVN